MFVCFGCFRDDTPKQGKRGNGNLDELPDIR